jgi:hypothetical protein
MRATWASTGTGQGRCCGGRGNTPHSRHNPSHTPAWLGTRTERRAKVRQDAPDSGDAPHPEDAPHSQPACPGVSPKGHRRNLKQHGTPWKQARNPPDAPDSLPGSPRNPVRKPAETATEAPGNSPGTANTEQAEAKSGHYNYCYLCNRRTIAVGTWAST